MGCTNCIQTTAQISGFIPANCRSINPCFLDSKCVVYNGPDLTCSGINTNDNLETILQKIDPLLCSASGDYSSYNTFCLAPITTQKEFVESISDFVCTLRSDFDTFTGTTYPTYQVAVNARFVALEVPGITCASAGVTNTDTLQTVLTKYCSTFANIFNQLDISGANWNSCYVVSPLPTTPTEGFNTLIQQICLLKSEVGSGGALPTFNNVGSCLPAPLTTTDTLVDTVNKIKTRLCQTGTLDTTTLTWGCVTAPTGAQNLQDGLQNILTQIQTMSQALPFQFSNDFTITNVDNGNLCLGKHVALATPSTQDRFVAATSSDASPGVLQDKLLAGTNVTLDYITTPGKVIITSTATASSNYQVKINSGDTLPDYLGAKIAGGAAVYGVQVSPSLDTVAEQVVLGISIDPALLFSALLGIISTDQGVRDAFCAAVSACPSPCAAPSNVTVVFTSGTTTTTTSTTTTTTTTTTTSTTTSTSTTTTTTP